MCVYPLMVPASSLSISPSRPYACLDCERGHTGQDPARLAGTRDCVCPSVCVRPSVTTEVGRVTDHPWPPPESVVRVRIALVTDVECVHMRAPIHNAGVLASAPGSIFISSRRVWPPTADITLHPLLSPISVFWTRWGARVTSDPPPLCDWWDSPALSPPSIVPWRASDTAWAHLLRPLPPRTWAS